jgi:hypothetical protein
VWWHRDKKSEEATSSAAPARKPKAG